MYNQYPYPQQQFMGAPQGYGTFYGARPTPKFTQPVTPELSKMLLQQNSDLDIRVSNVDKIRSWCTHREHGTGRPALVENADGTVTCRVCGKTFKLVDLTDDDVKKLVGDMSNAMNTVKVMYADIPEEFEKAYMIIDPLLDKFPELWKRASQNFGMYEYYTGNIQYAPNGGVNNWQAANSMINGFNLFQQNPMMYQQPYPVYQQAPMYQPNMGGYAVPPQGAPVQQPAAAPVAAPAIDPYGMVYPGGPFNTQMQPGFNPLMATPGAMAAPAPAPAAAAPAAEVQQTKQMSV